MTDVVLQAAAPELVAALVAARSFVSTMGADPAQWVLKYPGAKLVLVGTLMSLVPALAQSEAGALDTLILSKIDEAIAKLQAK